MNVDIAVINYKIARSLDNAPHMLDWGALGLPDDPEGFRREYFNWSFDMREVEGGYEVDISCDYNIPCGIVHNNPIQDGTWYRYGGATTFHVEADEMTPAIIAELALFHSSRYPVIIAHDTSRKTNGRFVNNTLLPTFSKLLLMAEERF